MGAIGGFMRTPRKSKPEKKAGRTPEEIEERRTRAKELYNWLGYGAGNEKLIGLPVIDQETGEEEYMVAMKVEGDRWSPIALMFMDAPKAVERYKPVKE